MNPEAKCGKMLAVKGGLLVCSNCRQKTNQAIEPDTVAFHLRVWCKRCKTQMNVNIKHGQCFEISRCR